jgi:hypothetical protein
MTLISNDLEIKKKSKVNLYSKKSIIEKILNVAGNAYGKDNVEVEFIDSYIVTTIRFPKINITNGRSSAPNNTTIHNFFVKFSIDPKGLKIMSGISGAAMAATSYNMLSGYVHSHLTSASNDKSTGWTFKKFCTGSGPISRILNMTHGEKNQKKSMIHIMAYIFHLREFLSWQSDSGIPFYYLNNRINNFLSNSQSNNRNLLNENYYHENSELNVINYELMMLIKDVAVINVFKDKEGNFKQITLVVAFTTELLRSFAEKIKLVIDPRFFKGLICYRASNGTTLMEKENIDLDYKRNTVIKMCETIPSITFNKKIIKFKCVDFDDMENLSNSENEIDTSEEIVNPYYCRNVLYNLNKHLTDFYLQNSIKL